MDVVDTALREAWEEVGLRRDQVEVFGTLPRHETVTSFSVTPIIAKLETDFIIRPEPGEVEEVFCAPLAHVLNPAQFTIQWQKVVKRSAHSVFHTLLCRETPNKSDWTSGPLMGC